MKNNIKIYQHIDRHYGKRRLDRRYPIFGLLIFTIVATFSFFLTRNAKKIHAVDFSKFKAGNIIADEVMRDFNSLDEQAIQAFLKSKNHCRNTDIQIAKQYPKLKYNIQDGHFVCMADDTFLNNDNGEYESAAKIIWRLSQKYKINPKVLLVTLEKEQSLVTDSYPNNIQYRSATGFGCPDNSDCDSKYYGLYNQLKGSARLYDQVLSGGWTNYPVGENQILYNPDKACGSGTVKIENLATSALYRYTPYQPNKEALNAYPGTAQCGAYGNRNFFAHYTNWFGLPNDPKNVSKKTQSETESNKPKTESKDKQPETPKEDSMKAPAKPNKPNNTPKEEDDHKNMPKNLVEVYKKHKNILGKKLKVPMGKNDTTGIEWQEYENGFVVGNDKKGWFISIGKSREVWKKHNFEYGVLGFPVSNFKKNDTTGIEWQEYENGFVVGNDKKGWFISYGKIREKWQRSGFEYGRYGFPTSDVIYGHQSYEGGVIFQ